MKINEYINHTKTTFARFAIALASGTSSEKMFEYIPYLLVNAEEAKRVIRDMLKSTKQDDVDKANRFLTDIVAKQRFIFQDNTFTLSDLYSCWEDLLGDDVTSKDTADIKQVIDDTVRHTIELQTLSKVNPIQKQFSYNIDKDKLESYFVAKFRGIGRESSTNYFEMLISALQNKTYNGKEIAQIALLIYEGGQMTTAKPNSFSKWHTMFCECTGAKFSKYDNKKKLSKEISDNLKSRFSYLQK